MDFLVVLVVESIGSDLGTVTANLDITAAVIHLFCLRMIVLTLRHCHILRRHIVLLLLLLGLGVGLLSILRKLTWRHLLIRRRLLEPSHLEQ